MGLSQQEARSRVRCRDAYGIRHVFSTCRGSVRYLHEPLSDLVMVYVAEALKRWLAYFADVTDKLWPRVIDHQ